VTEVLPGPARGETSLKADYAESTFSGLVNESAPVRAQNTSVAKTIRLPDMQAAQPEPTRADVYEAPAPKPDGAFEQKRVPTARSYSARKWCLYWYCCYRCKPPPQWPLPEP
jgi:hypothetical protein